MVFYKSCPRCKGDMHRNRDMYGDYKECLMCGFMVDYPTEAPRFTTTNEKSRRRRETKKRAEAA